MVRGCTFATERETVKRRWCCCNKFDGGEESRAMVRSLKEWGGARLGRELVDLLDRR